MRLTCARSATARCCLGACSPRNVKIQGFAGTLWSGFGTSELRVQLTSAHTHAH